MDQLISEGFHVEDVHTFKAYPCPNPPFTVGPKPSTTILLPPLPISQLDWANTILPPPDGIMQLPFPVAQCRRPVLATFRRYCLSTLSPPKVRCRIDEGSDEDFLPWLEREARTEISSVLAIGKSAYGRSLFASKSIRAGECMLKVPFSVQISPNDALPEIKSLWGEEIGYVAKLALVLLVEQKRGQESKWAPYLIRLPQPGEMHNTIFWSNDELEMIRQSWAYKETSNLKSQIEKEFEAVKPVLSYFPDFFEDITLKDFMHAYSLVGSRAWGSKMGLSLIPFADFLNHDGVSEAYLIGDEGKQWSEVIADRDYSPGEELLIRYGKFSNATLLLDYGFSLPNNIYDQVLIELDIHLHDPLLSVKLEILNRYGTPAVKDDNGFRSSWNSFMIKEVKSAKRNGRGIPQSLRAFARIFCCSSSEELHNMEMEAAQNDGRLARRPLQSCLQEFQAHHNLLSQVAQFIEKYDASVKLLNSMDLPPMSNKSALRRQMAADLLTGELRVLQSAHRWLENYCETLRPH